MGQLKITPKENLKEELAILGQCTLKLGGYYVTTLVLTFVIGYIASFFVKADFLLIGSIVGGFIVSSLIDNNIRLKRKLKKYENN